MRGRFGHASTAAAGAEAAPFARQRHHKIARTTVAVESNQALGQHAAIEEGSQLLLHEARHAYRAIVHRGSLQECLQVILQDLVKHALLGSPALVGRASCIASALVAQAGGRGAEGRHGDARRSFRPEGSRECCRGVTLHDGGEPPTAADGGRQALPTSPAIAWSSLLSARVFGSLPVDERSNAN